MASKLRARVIDKEDVDYCTLAFTKYESIINDLIDKILWYKGEEMFEVIDYDEPDYFYFNHETFIEFIEKGDFSIFTEEEETILKGIYEEVNGIGDKFGTDWFLVEFYVGDDEASE